MICEMLERSSLQFTEGTALVHDNRRELYTDSGGKIQSQLSLSSLELTVTKVSKKESHQKRKRMKRITLKKTENTTTCIYLFFAASSSTISPCSTDALVLIQLSFFVKTKLNTYPGTPTIFIIKTTAAPSHDHPDATHAFSHDDVHSF